MTNHRPKEISGPRLYAIGGRFWRLAQFIQAAIIVLFISVLTHGNAVAQRDTSTQKQQPTKDPDQPNMDGLVEVSFKIDESGRIQIVHINSTSTQLTEYVVKKLTKIKLDTESGSEGKVITYRFVFKKQA